MLHTQEEQLRCFANAARRLAPGGAFVVEAFIPELVRYDSSQTARTSSMVQGQLQIDLVTVDLVQQQITSQHIRLGGSKKVENFTVKMRFAFPAELDLMARLTGLRLRERWGDWDGSACTGKSGKYISIYEH